jgi:hypothetical protein
MSYALTRHARVQRRAGQVGGGGEPLQILGLERMLAVGGAELAQPLQPGSQELTPITEGG